MDTGWKAKLLPFVPKHSLLLDRCLACPIRNNNFDRLANYSQVLNYPERRGPRFRVKRLALHSIADS